MERRGSWLLRRLSLGQHLREARRAAAGARLSHRFALLLPESAWRGSVSRCRRLPAIWESQQRRSRSAWAFRGRATISPPASYRSSSTRRPDPWVEVGYPAHRMRLSRTTGDEHACVLSAYIQPSHPAPDRLPPPFESSSPLTPQPRRKFQRSQRLSSTATCSRTCRSAANSYWPNNTTSRSLESQCHASATTSRSSDGLNQTVCS